MTWLHRIRLKVLAYAFGIALAAFAMISLTTVPAWPIIGVAFAAVALTVNRVAARLSEPACLGCGQDLAGRPSGGYGVACGECGTINPARGLARDPVGKDLMPPTA